MAEKKSREDRRQFAEHLIAAMQTTLGVTIELTTKKFFMNSDNFEIHIVHNEPTKTTGYFEKEKIEYLHVSNGNYQVFFPEKYLNEEIDPKDVGKLLKKERERVIRYLHNNNHKYLGKGKAKAGSYKTNQYESIVNEKMLSINATGEPVARQILTLMNKYYKKVTGTEVALSGNSVKVKFYDEWFPKPAAINTEVQPSTQTETPVSTDEQKLEMEMMLEDAKNALGLIGKVKKYFFMIFKAPMAKALNVILQAGNYKITQEYYEGPEGDKRKITRELTSADIEGKIITPFIDMVCEEKEV